MQNEIITLQTKLLVESNRSDLYFSELGKSTMSVRGTLFSTSSKGNSRASIKRDPVVNRSKPHQSVASSSIESTYVTGKNIFAAAHDKNRY